MKFKITGFSSGCFFFLSFLASSPCFSGAGFKWAGGGSQTGNGRTLLSEELQTKRVYRNLSNYIDRGLKLKDSNLNSEETDWLKKIRKILPTERHRGQKIHFVSESDDPEKFIHEEQSFAIWTEDKIGGDLWINSDFLDNVFDTSVKLALSQRELAGMFVQALAEHVDSSDQTKTEHLVEGFLKNLGAPPQTE